MNDRGLPVTVAVRRPNGATEQVRVGTAFRTGEGFTLKLDDLTVGMTPDTTSAPAPSPSRRSAPPADARPAMASGGPAGGPVFPPYGRSKGAPVYGASMQDLEFYANGCRRTLNDPAKARWHDKERELLAAIEGEMARQRGDTGGGGGGYEPAEYGGPRAADDEDVPF